MGFLGTKACLLLLLLLSRFSHVRLCATAQTAAHQAPLSLGFSRQEYWSGLPFPSPSLLETQLKSKCIAQFLRVVELSNEFLTSLGLLCEIQFMT